MTQKNTLLQAATSNAETRACKRVFFSPTQEEIQIIYFPTLRFFYFFFQRTVRNLKDRSSILGDFGKSVCKLDTTHFRTERRATDNIGFAKAGVTCFYDSFVLNQSSVLRLNGSAENPRLRKAAKR